MRKFTILFAFFIFLGMQAAFAQEVTGTVTDIEEGTLPGVSVVVEGTLVGTVTNTNGVYTLMVPEGDNVLVFSFVGMSTMEVDIDGRSVIDVTMEEDVVGLDEVVVTALGVKRETKALGYAVENVSGDELTRSGEVNAIEALAGKAAGVQVIGSGGTPGASAKILIRGNSTFTGENQPLIVVDGVPIDNTTSSSVAGDYPFNQTLAGVNNSNRGLDLNPDDIESVTVLKGPAAAALYGVRAGNGAIVYTTKRGTYGQKLKVSYNFSADISQINKMPDLQTRYAQGYGGGADDGEGGLTDGTYLTMSDESAGTSSSWGPRISTLEGINSYDNSDLFFKNGTAFTHNISVSGGGEKSAFRIAISQLDQSGMVPNTTLNRTSVRFTGDIDITKDFRMGATANYVHTGGFKAQNGSNLSGVMLGLSRAPASWNVKGGEGENGYTNADGTQYQYFLYYDNPLWTVYRNPFHDNVNRFLGNVFFDYHPYNWLKVVYRLGVDTYTDNRKQVFEIGSWDPASAPEGELYDNTLRRFETYHDLLITGDHRFSDNFRGSLTVGGNINHREFQDTYARSRFLSIPGFHNLSNGSDLYASEYTEYVRTSALFFDLNLEFMNQLYLNVTGRNEWSSTFGPNKNNFFYPSASLSWVFTELLDISWWDFGKARLAIAQAGISPDPYTSQTYFTSPLMTDGFTDGFSFPYLGQAGFGWSSQLGNSDLQPELVTGYEFGLDLRFFKGRLNLDLTLYRQNSSNILVFRPIAPSTGYNTFVSNSGKMFNKGIEIILSGDIIRKSDFTWNAQLNYSLNENEVTELASGVDEINVEAAFTSIGGYAIVGQPYGVMYGTKYQKTEDGRFIINPETGLPFVEDERGYIGNPFPKWLAGLRNTLSYKGLSLTFLFDRRTGGDIWCGTINRLNRLGRTENVADARDNNTKYVVPGVYVDDAGNITGENNVELDPATYWSSFKGDAAGSAVSEAIYDGSWFRLRDVTLSYNINMHKYQKVIRSIEVYVTGRNLWLSTDYPGVDPETSLTGAGSNNTGLDYFNNPGSRSYIFGIRLDF